MKKFAKDIRYNASLILLYNTNEIMKWVRIYKYF